MSRVRLTARSRKAVEDKIPYPGNVNQEDRKFKERDQYHTFEHTVNHELPDTRDEWKDNPRDDIGFGIPKVAKIYASAQKAVRLAVLFLGDKCGDDVIESQARDFMRLGSARIDKALDRFATTEELYAAVNEDEAPEEDNEDKVMDSNSLVKQHGGPDKAQREVEASENAVNEGEEIQEVSKETEEMQKVVEATEEEVVEEEVEAQDERNEVGVGVLEDEVEAGDEECEDDEVEAEDECEDSAMDDIIAEDDDEDVNEDLDENEELASVFADATNEDEKLDDDEEIVQASANKKAKKVGIKHLGGQPRIANVKKSANDLLDLWGDAPDISDVF